MDTIHVYIHTPFQNEHAANLVTELRQDKDSYIVKETIDHGLGGILAVHTPDYHYFLHELCHDDDKNKTKSHSCYPHIRLLTPYMHDIFNNGKDMFQYVKRPQMERGLVGYHFFDGSMPTATDYERAYWSCQVAISCAKAVVAGDCVVAVGICEAVGHFAHKDLTGCGSLLNHAAVCAQHIATLIEDIDGGVTVLDIDYDQGLGTHAIFHGGDGYGDPVVVTVHGENGTPFFLGAVPRTRTTAKFFARRIVLPDYAGLADFMGAIDKFETLIGDMNVTPLYLVVSLGCGLVCDNTDARFTLTPDDLYILGCKIAEMTRDDIAVVVLTEGIPDYPSGIKGVTEFLRPFTAYTYSFFM